MKQLKLSFLLCFIKIVTFAQTAQQGEQAQPMPSIGVTVKKNPEGETSKMVETNGKGQATLAIKQSGNYTLTLNQTKGKSAGEPLPNLTIKLGKNPGSNQFQVTTNEKGEAVLNDLEKGKYTFEILQSASTDIKVLEKIKEREERFTKSDEEDGHVTLLRFSKLYIGGGLLMPSSTTKDGANSVNGLDLNVGYYHPIWAWEKSRISLGINAELGYNLGNGERSFNNQYTVYNLAGQTQEPSLSFRKDGRPIRARFAAGLQMNAHLSDKFTLSPIINVGYLSTTNNSFSVTETLYYNSSVYNYALLSQKESKTSGIGILPKLRMSYNITSRIGIWLEGNYTIGPKIKTDVTTFAPEPSAAVDGTYTLSQFENGAYTSTKRETSYSAMGINGGLVFSFGYRRTSERLRHKNK